MRSAGAGAGSCAASRKRCGRCSSNAAPQHMEIWACVEYGCIPLPVKLNLLMLAHAPFIYVAVWCCMPACGDGLAQHSKTLSLHLQPWPMDHPAPHISSQIAECLWPAEPTTFACPHIPSRPPNTPMPLMQLQMRQGACAFSPAQPPCKNIVHRNLRQVNVRVSSHSEASTSQSSIGAKPLLLQRVHNSLPAAALAVAAVVAATAPGAQAFEIHAEPTNGGWGMRGACTCMQHIRPTKLST